MPLVVACEPLGACLVVVWWCWCCGGVVFVVVAGGVLWWWLGFGWLVVVVVCGGGVVVVVVVVGCLVVVVVVCGRPSARGCGVVVDCGSAGCILHLHCTASGSNDAAPRIGSEGVCWSEGVRGSATSGSKTRLRE